MNVTALVGVGRGHVNIVRTETCLIDAASAAYFSLSSCLGEREALTMSYVAVLPRGGVTDGDGGQRVTRVKRLGGLEVERLMPFSFRISVLGIDFL